MRKFLITFAILAIPLVMTYISSPSPLPQLFAPSFLLGVAGIATMLYSLSLISQGRTMKTVVLVLICLALVLELMDLICIFKTGTPFDMSFVQNFDFYAVKIAQPDEIMDFVIMCIVMMILATTGCLVYRKQEINGLPIYLKAGLLVAGIGLTCGFFSPQKDVAAFAWGMYFAHHENIEFPKETLLAAGIKPCDVEYGNLQAIKGKNLVFVFLESLENAFTEEELFPGLTPNINRIKKESICFDNVHMADGAGCSVFAMYISFLGSQLPPFAFIPSGKGGNKTKLLTFPEILHKAGYRQVFVYNKLVSQVGTMDAVTENVGYVNDFPETNKDKANDATIFDESLKIYKHLSLTGKPFNLTLFTVDTHSPGYSEKNWLNADSSKVKGINGKSNAVLNATHNADMLLGKFIDELKKSPGWKDTIVFVMNDHYIMQCSVTVALQESHDRRMLMFALGGEMTPKVIKTAGKTFDVAPTVLELLGVKHNYVFPVGESLLKENTSSIRLEDATSLRASCLSAYFNTKRTQ